MIAKIDRELYLYSYSPATVRQFFDIPPTTPVRDCRETDARGRRLYAVDAAWVPRLDRRNCLREDVLPWLLTTMLIIIICLALR